MKTVPPEFVKAANLLNLLKMVGRTEGSHPFMASLYAPLALGDFIESRKQRSEGGRGVVPLLGGLALSAMAAPHIADPVSKYMKRHELQSAGQLAKHLLGKLTPKAEPVVRSVGGL